MKSFWLDERGSRGVRAVAGDAAERSGGWQAAAAGQGFKREIGVQDSVSYRERTANK